MKRSYKIYNFAEDNSIITRTEQIKDYIESVIKGYSLKLSFNNDLDSTNFLLISWPLVFHADTLP